jgi:choline dehydrogenase-like flavoprotein
VSQGRLGLAGVAHQNGTMRLGSDPRTAPLDLDCKLYDLDNVYVADSSFFVSSTAVNPTLTIIANSLRVAEVVAGRLGTTTLGERLPSQVHVPGQASGLAVSVVSR